MSVTWTETPNDPSIPLEEGPFTTLHFTSTEPVNYIAVDVSTGVEEIAYRDGAYRGLYAQYSTIDASGLTGALYRKGGWPAPPKIYTNAGTAVVSGESNTASNVGTGAGVFKQKVGVDLQFKSLVAGANITLTNNVDDITISSVAATTSVTMTGDVTGASNANTVTKLQNIALPVPSTGVLTATAGVLSWSPVSGVVTLAGDVTGSSSATTVTKIQNVAVPVPTTGVLTATGGVLTWSEVGDVVPLDGDVTGDSDANTVAKIRNAPVPPLSNGVLTSSSGVLSWSPVSGIVTLAGDVNGSSMGNTVNKILNVTIPPLSNGVLTSTAGVLSWSPTSGVVTLAGDVTGSSGANTVTKIQNAAVPVPTNGVLTAVGGVLSWAAAGGSGTVTGPATTTSGNLATWNSANGTVLADSGRALSTIPQLVTASQANGDVIASGGSTGTGTTAARSDHTHGHGAQAGGTLHATATTSVAGFCSAADKTKLDGIATGATNTALVTASQANGDVSVFSGTTGSATTAARSDHTHWHGIHNVGTLHAVATQSVPGFMSGADKTKLDGVATGATALALGTGNQFSAAGVTGTNGGNTGVATTAARSDHSHGHSDLAGGTLHAAATTTTAGFLSSTDKSRIDSLYATSQATKRMTRLISTHGWDAAFPTTTDPAQFAWKMVSTTPTTRAVLVPTSGLPNPNIWYVDLSPELPLNAISIASLEVRLAGSVDTDPTDSGYVKPQWVLAGYDQDNVRTVEIPAQLDNSITEAVYAAPHSVTWNGSLALSASKRYVLEFTPEGGTASFPGTRLLSIKLSCDYADAGTVADRFAALLSAKGIFAFEARSNTNNGTNVLTFVDLIDSSRVLTPTGSAVAKPVANAGYGGALVCTIPGSVIAMCNRPASEFRALHDGTGMEVRQICHPTQTKTQVTLTTRVSTAGITLLFSSAGNAYHSYVTNNGVYPASALIDTGPVTIPFTGNPLSTHFRYSSSTTPNWVSHPSGGGADKSGAQLVAPYAGDSEQTLEMFSDGTNHFVGIWFGTYAFKTLTATERALVDEYQLAMTGIVP